MVTTFSARLLSLANRCNPIVGGNNNNKRKHYNIDNNNDDNDGNDANGNNPITNNQATPPLPLQPNDPTLNMKRRYYAHTHHQDAAASNKRRRQKEELDYAADTIQTALTDADRLPMSIFSMRERRERELPMAMMVGCQVDDNVRDGCRVMTSRDFDELDENQDQEQQDEDDARLSKKRNGEQDVSNSNSSSNIVNSSSSTNDSYQAEYAGVYSMIMADSLIRSTRQYYRFSNDDNTNSAPSVSNILPGINSNRAGPSTQAAAAAGSLNNNINKLSKDGKKRPSEEDNNSEGLSSWTPSSITSEAGSSCQDFMQDIQDNNDKKNDIDNDNRSDGVSIDVDTTTTSSSTGEEEEAGSTLELSSSSSASSSRSSSSSSSSTGSSSGMDGPFFIIG